MECHSIRKFYVDVTVVGLVALHSLGGEFAPLNKAIPLKLLLITPVNLSPKLTKYGRKQKVKASLR